MSRSVFFSHATKDAPLVAELVDLVEDGIGVPEGEIFCSSLPGYGIPAGENFVGYMRSQIDAPKVVVLVLTENYFQSHFCLSELGAAWVKGHKIFPIIAPPLTFSHVKDVLLGTQAIKVDDDVAFNQLREALDQAGLASKSGTKWDIKRKLFLKKLPTTLAALPSPTTVDVLEHNELREKLAEAQEELLTYEAEADRLKQQISMLEQVKDAAEVARIRKQQSDSGYVQQFQALVKQVADMWSLVGGSEVLKALIADHYGHQYRVDMINFGSEFEEAALKRIINLETRQISWGAPRAKQLAAQLAAVDALLDNEAAYSEVSREFESKDIPLEPDNLEFWQEFYKV